MAGGGHGGVDDGDGEAEEESSSSSLPSVVGLGQDNDELEEFRQQWKKDLAGNGQQGQESQGGGAIGELSIHCLEYDSDIHIQVYITFTTVI